MAHDINRWVFQIPLEDVRTASRNISDNPCLLCGKEIKSKSYYVHLLTNGCLVSSNENLAESQGFFDIGANCRHKLPNNFYWSH